MPKRKKATQPIADQANLSEMAWSSAGASWECEPDNENGQCIFEVVENVITNVEQYSYNRRVTFTRDGKLYQFTCTMGHDGDHTYEDPYEVIAVPVSGFKYEKVKEHGAEDNRPDGPAALPPWGGWGKYA